MSWKTNQSRDFFLGKTINLEPINLILAEKNHCVENTYHNYLSKEYFCQLDGIRALCALGVISYHMTDNKLFEWLSGSLGVPVFFVLSGYLITTLALREERENGKVSLRSFYIRRSFRILPMYYLMLGITCILVFSGRWGQNERQNFERFLPSFILYYQDVAFAMDRYQHHTHFMHSWSLGYEEKFYIAWPLLAFVLLRGKTAFRLVSTTILFIGIALASTILCRIQGGWPIDHYALGLMLSGYTLILPGCLLALLLDSEASFKRLEFLGTKTGSTFALILFLVIYFLNPFVVWWRAEYRLVFCLGTVVLLASILITKSRLFSILSTAPLIFIGRLSYGIYLVHPLSLSFVQRLIKPGSGRVSLALLCFVMACAVSIMVAYLLSIAFERPLIRIGRSYARSIGGQSGRPLEAARIPGNSQGSPSHFFPIDEYLIPHNPSWDQTNQT